VYRVTGSKENDLRTYVGQRIEVTGTLKHDDTTDAMSSAGASGAGTPANTPELTIESIRPTSGGCTRPGR
jgi:hypothetical protein